MEPQVETTTETTPSANGESKKQQPYKLITMAELGQALPLGTHDPAGGKLNKTMSHRNWTLKVEKALGKLRDKKRFSNMAKFATLVVAYLYEELGALKMEGDEKKLDQDIMQVGQMWMGDVLYAYLYLRKTFVGDYFDMELTCPGCLGKSTIKIDLNTVEVRMVEQFKDALWQYELKHPMKIRNEKVTGFTMGPARWAGVERSAGTGIDTGGPKSTLIWSSIFETLGANFPSPITEPELEEMSKYDLEMLTTLINEHHVGPDMSVEGSCPKQGCGRAFRMSLDWTYDSFFGASGPSSP